MVSIRDSLPIVSRSKIRSEQADRWLYEHIVLTGRELEMAKLEGYEERVKKSLKKIPLEWRVQSLTPRQRIKGLKPEELVLALGDEMLRGLSEEFIANLPPKVRAQVRRRLRKH